ncbi:helix-turn-helix transcriptional regulator [Salinarimonas sp.]|uniref:helix-turn-helix transcriptional regulator n=1 Tax=Salinarimonas sp. TaxID=2766526 RepID=UPI0032D8EF84
MPKPATRPYSRRARDAAELLGLSIRNARIDRQMTVAEVAERAGVSRGLVHRIEAGDMGCAIGAAFEVAAVVGAPLFEPEPRTLAPHIAAARDRLTLLPKAVRPRTRAVKDDF